MIAISGTDWFSRRGGTTRDIYEPTVYLYGESGRNCQARPLGQELRSVVGPDVTGNAPQDEEVGENVDHIGGLELAGDTDRQAFMAEPRRAR
jgi:hypothetical protein